MAKTEPLNVRHEPRPLRSEPEEVVRGCIMATGARIAAWRIGDYPSPIRAGEEMTRLLATFENARKELLAREQERLDRG